ncbi:DUF4214 domain-containing protein [Methylobacterium sp. SyP6R]|uniref:DUF4214 domain-containing protein n=1 Tax=Methylobacterium sp. SyP6R TaxID=2718876 RepID=UPI001F2D823E|nr:DUF4214 domain-containing protein [Methylobacterium sp. SyP6R]MCF4130157.1 DUF4214 domain-containing protein [Methylobacterium sp. SyP6R]
MPFSYTINLNDPQKRPEDASLLTDTRAALDAWASYITGKGSVDVQLNLVSLAGGFLADAGPALELAVDRDGARTVTQSNVITELLTGLDVNGAAPDLTINVNADLLSSLYLNPAPSSGGSVPRGKYDAVSILTHEIGHALGISGARDPATGALPANTETTWDRLVALQPDGTAYFTGANAQAVYGGPVPVTTIKNGEQYYHLANSASDPLSKDLMGGTGLAAGESRSISPLDLAILRDLGLTVSTYDKLQFGTIVHDAQGFGGQVYLLYDALLGRAPDPLGFGAWIDAVQTGTPLHDIAKAFLASPEGQARTGALGNADFVEQLYRTALDRPSDPGGLAAWTAALDAGTSRADVALGFALSPEHVANLKSTFDAGVYVPNPEAAEVARLYYGVLGRAPDSGGLAAWTAAVDHGTSLELITGSFLQAPEVQAKVGGLNNAQFVDAIYLNALGRHAEAGGLATWTGQLDSGVSRASVTVAIAESLEATLHHAAEIETGWHLA